MCGPPPMMGTVVPALEEWGVPEKKVHYEAFGPATVKKTPKAAEAIADLKEASASAAIEVVFAKSGVTAVWNSDASTILDFAEENDVAIDFGCRAGNCGTCITAIKSGQVEYEIEPGATPEDGSCLTCCAVPKSSLVLDA